MIAVNDQVVHYAAVLIAHRTVADPAVSHISKVVGKQILNIGKSVGAGNHNFPHVGYVKQPGVGAHCHMLGNYTGGVLHREKIPSEGYDFSSARHMAVI